MCRSGTLRECSGSEGGFASDYHNNYLPPQWSTTTMIHDPNDPRLQWFTTTMIHDHNDPRPQWSTTTMILALAPSSPPPSSRNIRLAHISAHWAMWVGWSRQEQGRAHSTMIHTTIIHTTIIYTTIIQAKIIYLNNLNSNNLSNNDLYSMNIQGWTIVDTVVQILLTVFV
jgi:hypothetical protein